MAMLNLLLARTGPWMGWLWTTTWQSAVLIGIILLVIAGLSLLFIKMGRR